MNITKISYFLMLFTMICTRTPISAQIINKKYYFDSISQSQLISRLTVLSDSIYTQKSTFNFINVTFGYARTIGIIVWEKKSKFCGVYFYLSSQDSLIFLDIPKRKLLDFQNKFEKVKDQYGDRYFNLFQKRLNCNNSSLIDDRYFISKVADATLEYVHYNTGCMTSNNDKISLSFLKAMSVLVPDWSNILKE